MEAEFPHRPTTPEQTPQIEELLAPADLQVLLRIKEEIVARIGRHYQRQNWDPAVLIELASNLLKGDSKNTLLAAEISFFALDIYEHVGIPLEACFARLSSLPINQKTYELIEAHLRSGCRVETFIPELISAEADLREVYQDAVGGLGFDSSLAFLSDLQGFMEVFTSNLSNLWSSIQTRAAIEGKERTAQRIEHGWQLATFLTQAYGELNVDPLTTPLNVMAANLFLSEAHCTRLSELSKYFITRARERGAQPAEVLKLFNGLMKGVEKLGHFEFCAKKVTDGKMQEGDAAPIKRSAQKAEWLLDVASEVRSMSPVRLEAFLLHLVRAPMHMIGDIQPGAATRGAFMVRKLGSKVGMIYPRSFMNLINTPVCDEDLALVCLIIDKSLTQKKIGEDAGQFIFHHNEFPHRGIDAVANAIKAGKSSDKITAALNEIAALPLDEANISTTSPRVSEIIDKIQKIKK